MSIAKKSTTWLVVLFVIFAMILTASFAVGNFAKANAEPEPETENVSADVIVWATDSESLGSYPTLAALENDTRTITVYYGFDIPAASTTSLAKAEFVLKPTIVRDNVASVADTVAVNPALENAVVSVVENDVLRISFPDSYAGTVASLDCSSDQSNYLFYATFDIADESGSSIGLYELTFGDVGTIMAGTPLEETIPSNFSIAAADPDDDPISYLPVTTIDTKSFTINSVVAKPVVDPTSFVYNGEAQSVFSGTNAGYTYGCHGDERR